MGNASISPRLDTWDTWDTWGALQRKWKPSGLVANQMMASSQGPSASDGKPFGEVTLLTTVAQLHPD